jgi:hypothetical protein
MINGTSKVFEIKTELDSSKRLQGQLLDYSLVFDELYIVTHHELTEKYLDINPSIGVIELTEKPRSLKMREIRPAKKNREVCFEAVIRSIRTEEYKNIVKKYFEELPDMDSFNMFKICQKLMSEIPSDKLNTLFIEQLKKRKSNTHILNGFNKELRQIGLALKLDLKNQEELFGKLDKLIQI